jgi:hypothetical protein
MLSTLGRSPGFGIFKTKAKAMNYNRSISKEFSKLLEDGGKLRWLFDFVKNHNELDFLIVKNKSKTIERISIYRGLTKIITLRLNADTIHIDAAHSYKKIFPNLYGKKSINDNYQNDIEKLIALIANNSQFDRYYKNKKEGYYQNELSRKYGICGSVNDDFVIIDKEAVIGYSNQKEKDKLLGDIQKKYKQLQKDISSHNPERYGSNLENNSIGNKPDFLALDKDGNILLIEYKHGTNTAGIYLSPLQIGMYYEIFDNYPKKDLECAVFEMLVQKQKIGLINPDWSKPDRIKDIIPVLIISEFNYKSGAKIRFDEILQFTRERHGAGFLNNLQTYNYTSQNGLANW